MEVRPLCQHHLNLPTPFSKFEAWCCPTRQGTSNSGRLELFEAADDAGLLGTVEDFESEDGEPEIQDGTAK